MKHRYFASAFFALAATGITLGAAASDFVSVPSGYVYNPSLGGRHDYCTNSPDEFPAPIGKNAKFQGPCARHDMCYDSSTDKKVCDLRLARDMRTNCAHAYGVLNPNRAACYATANLYLAAVVAAH
jgi:hypothetical protein